ncbi:MAG: hypothetical protein IT437_14355 [Phycisphaerales bacterium]|nr:hypothetical protein [Phycisphaerales bacterium]
MADLEYNWPKRGDRAFGPRVPSGAQGDLDAFVLPSEGAYVAGFQRAADMIVMGARNDDLNPDDLFFPVAYLYRHHLELMLKELVRLGAGMGAIGECEALLGEHNLHRLWNKAKELIRSVWPGPVGDDIKAVERVILEFHRLDPSGQAFRYCRDKHGSPLLVSAPSRVDLRALASTVDAVSRFLDAAYAGIDACDPGSP